MLGVVISVGVGGLLLFVAWQAIRSGELVTSAGALRREHRMFYPGVVALGLAGAGLWAWTGLLVTDGALETSGSDTAVEGQGWVATLPARWGRADAQAVPPGAEMWGDGRGELLVTRSESDVALAGGARTVEAVLAEVSDLAEPVSDRPPEVRRGARTMSWIQRYGSPRGPVRSRVMAWIEPGPEAPRRVLLVFVCTDGAEDGACVQVIESIAPSAPDDARLPLDQVLSP